MYIDKLIHAKILHMWINYVAVLPCGIENCIEYRYFLRYRNYKFRFGDNTTLEFDSLAQTLASSICLFPMTLCGPDAKPHPQKHTLTHMLTLWPIHVSVFLVCLSYSCTLVSLRQMNTQTHRFTAVSLRIQ